MHQDAIYVYCFNAFSIPLHIFMFGLNVEPCGSRKFQHYSSHKEHQEMFTPFLNLNYNGSHKSILEVLEIMRI